MYVTFTVWETVIGRLGIEPKNKHKSRHLRRKTTKKPQTKDAYHPIALDAVGRYATHRLKEFIMGS